jgi:hypothetical protein
LKSPSQKLQKIRPNPSNQNLRNLKQSRSNQALTKLLISRSIRLSKKPKAIRHLSKNNHQMNLLLKSQRP